MREVSRLAVSGVIIYRVLSGQASFSALAMPLLTIAGLIVVRSLFQYWQNAVSHHTANIVKIKLREEVYGHLFGVGTWLRRPNPDRRPRADARRRHRAHGDILRTILVPVHRLRHRSSRHIRLHGHARPLHSAHIPRLLRTHHGRAGDVPALEFARAVSNVAGRMANLGPTSSTVCKASRTPKNRSARANDVARNWHNGQTICIAARWASWPRTRRQAQPRSSS